MHGHGLVAWLDAPRMPMTRSAASCIFNLFFLLFGSVPMGTFVLGCVYTGSRDCHNHNLKGPQTVVGISEPHWQQLGTRLIRAIIGLYVVRS